jgi:hypothetical protein
MARYRKAMSRQAQVTVRRSALGTLSAGGGDLGAAAAIIAAAARTLAARWSRQVPAAIGVSVSGNVATISCDAPPAYPNEVEGVRHPVYGNPDAWVTNAHRPFLEPAADAAADAAMARYADKIDGWARRAGYR